MSAPAEHILYRHWGSGGQLLYAGMTNNPPARLTKHRGEAAWWSAVSWTTYEKFPSREALKAGETWAIQHESPLWNIQERVHENATRTSTDPGNDKYRPITASALTPELSLIHPLSRQFSVYGGHDTMHRARAWALRNRYYLLGSGPRCAHALYRMDCPNLGSCIPGADHTQVWVPAPDFSRFERHSGAEAPFILTQPYRPASDEAQAEMTAYAVAHGLVTDTWASDAWYNPGECTAIRLTADDKGYVSWPLATEALSLLCAWRDDWPDDIPEWLA